MAAGQPGGAENGHRDPPLIPGLGHPPDDGPGTYRGCLWGVVPGLLLWLIAVASVACALTDCLH